MTFEKARAIADAVLLEGYALYPYRASSLKNRYRWSFGVLAPRAFSEAAGSDPWWLQAQFLVEGTERTDIVGRLRFLQLEKRSLEERTADGLREVESLDAGGQLWLSWEEGLTHEIDFELALGSVVAEARSIPFEVPASRAREPILDDREEVAGFVTRERWPVSGLIHVAAKPLEGERPLLCLEIRVENLTPWQRLRAPRDEAMRASCLSTHVLLAARDGAFLSQMDPPSWAAPHADACRNVGIYPVLVGEEGQRDLLLASPIILYDHPKIAPESPGDFFDATEIDALLTLRTRTLTDDEKRQVRATDERTARLLERVEELPPEMMERLHGAVRELQRIEGTRASEREGIEIGARVCPLPRRRTDGSQKGTDAQDALFVGRAATVEKIEHDVDGRVFVAVTFEDDPAADLNRWYGRFHYYELDEVERLAPRGESAA